MFIETMDALMADASQVGMNLYRESHGDIRDIQHRAKPGGGGGGARGGEEVNACIAGNRFLPSWMDFAATPLLSTLGLNHSLS